jgi:hypothetical protein
MNKSDSLDGYFKDRLEHYSSETPMHLWDRIESARSNRRKRPFVSFRIFLMLLVPVCLFAAGVATWWTYEPQSAVSELDAFFHLGTDGSTTVQEIKEAVGFTPANDVNSSGAVTPPQDENFVPPATDQQPIKQQILPASTIEEFTEKGIVAFEGAEDKEQSITETEKITQEESADVLTDVNNTETETTAPLNRLPGLVLAELDWENETPKFPDPDESCSEFKELPLEFFFDLSWSHNLAIRSLTAKSPEFIEYADRRRESEEAAYGFSAGAELGATLYGVGLQTGFSYAQINEVFSFVEGNVQRYEVEKVFDTNGNLIRVDSTLVTGTLIKKTYNRYRMIDIPVMVGYEFDLPKFVLSVYGGANFNLVFLQKGEFLSPELEPVNFSSSSSSPFPAFKDQLSVSWVGSIGLHYKLSDRMQVTLEPNFRYFPDPITIEGYSLNQKYFVTGIRTGVRFRM